jgi:hypothetical protein
MAKRTNQLIEELGPNVDLFVLEFAVNDCKYCTAKRATPARYY